MSSDCKECKVLEEKLEHVINYYNKVLDDIHEAGVDDRYHYLGHAASYLIQEEDLQEGFSRETLIDRARMMAASAEAVDSFIQDHVRPQCKHGDPLFSWNVLNDIDDED